MFKRFCEISSGRFVGIIIVQFLLVFFNVWTESDRYFVPMIDTTAMSIVVGTLRLDIPRGIKRLHEEVVRR